ncbi:ABC transporter ATP-binding protein [Mycoplasmatota bacterium]|nr:ABC transporter ATP-binding protein [Mycoplasmatota bacterium]
MKKILRVNDLRISFKTNSGNVQAIRGVSFNLFKGETLAIVGESGSGKSVTTKAIMGMLANNATVEQGSILFDGNDILKLTKRELTKIRGSRISMIFQDPMTSLNPTMTIGKQIMESMLEHRKMKRSDAKIKVIELLDLVGIESPSKRFKSYPHQLSGGMRQRVVIAIALASEPDILIADEPTTALDVTIQSQILELIKELQMKLKISIIFITHDLGVVANMADRVAVMYAGKIVEYGLSDEIYYDSKHPYTWGLLASVPDMSTKVDMLYSIPGTTPNLISPPVGDAFAYRSEHTLKIDFEEQPPFFKVSDTHYVASWLLHEYAPKIEMPEHLQRRIKLMLSEEY